MLPWMSSAPSVHLPPRRDDREKHFTSSLSASFYVPVRAFQSRQADTETRGDRQTDRGKQGVRESPEMRLAQPVLTQGLQFASPALH